MRSLNLVVFFLLASGCTAPDTQLTAVEADPDEAPAELPPDIRHEEVVLVTVGYSRLIEFQVATNATMTATLEWGLEAHNFDLVLTQNGNEVAASRTLLATEEAIQHTLEPGSYTLEILLTPAVATVDEYVVEATFSRPG